MRRARINKLLKFVFELVPTSYLPERLDVYLDTDDADGMNGYTDVEDFEIDICLPTKVESRKYPRAHTYRSAAGEFRYECWCEEFVALVAHECRHVWQARAPKSEKPQFEEVDAEAFARYVLDLYRERKKCRHAA